MTAPASSLQCRRCGAALAYTPGANDALVCAHCGERNAIVHAAPAAAGKVTDYRALLDARFASGPRTTLQTVKCGSCGAETSRPGNVLSDRCPFCDGVTVTSGPASQHVPDGVLPFVLDEATARAVIVKWEAALWFKPGPLFGGRPPEKVNALYLPHWSFDWSVTTSYVGSKANGPEQHGSVQTQLAGSTVLASSSVPTPIGADLEPWDLARIVAPSAQLLAGVHAETHGEREGLARSAALSHRLLERDVDAQIKAAIGGDRAFVKSRSFAYDNVTFRLLLLPVWSTGYRYEGRTYRVLVNARSGEVVGERPISGAKVRAAIAAPFAGPLVVGTVVAALASGHRVHAFLLVFWGTLVLKGIVALVVASGMESAGPPQQGQFSINRPAAEGRKNFAEMLSGVLQNDAGARRELWRGVGIVAIVASIFPLIGLIFGDRMPAAMVVVFHAFAALIVFAFAMSWRQQVREKRYFLGLTDVNE